ncbi:hypothetical protein [Thioclava sp. GXIMD4216]|uniref:hypothetical protein n=1 Tax=Thioclava sp. GXIMD4216 TaxID=3131929 RepID=UPI0030CE9EFB
MAMGQAGAMQAKLGLDLSQFQSGARAASAEAQKMAGNINQAWAGVRASVEGKAARSFDQLRASIDPAFAASQRYADIQRQVAGFVESGVASQRAANQVLEQAAAKYLGVATAADRAAQAVRAGEAAQAEQARSAANAARAYESLRASVDPLYASSQRYKQAVEVLNAAQAAGVIDDRARANTLKLLGQQLSATNGVMQKAGGISGRMSSAFSNASFQVQDFFVQIAGGTDAMRAFAMQAPQLLGALGFTGKLAMVGSALGTIVAVGAVVLPLLTDFGKKAKDLDTATSDLESSLGDLRSALETATTPLAALRKEFGDNAEAAREMNIAILDAKKIEGFDQIGEKTKAIQNSLKGVIGSLQDYDDAITQTGTSFMIYDQAGAAVDELNRKYGLTIDQARKVKTAMDEMAKAKSPQEVAAATQELYRLLGLTVDETGKIPEGLREARLAAAQTTVEAFQMRNLFELSDKLAAGLPVSLDSAADAAQRLASAMAAASGFSANLDNQIAMLDVQIEATRNKQNVANATRVAGLRLEAQALRDKAVAEGVDLALADAQLLSQNQKIDTMEKDLATLDQLTAAQKAATKAGTAGAKAAERLEKAQAKEAERWRDLIDPLNKYRRELAELNTLATKGLLTPQEVQKAMAQLNAGLADSLPLAGELTDTLVDGLFAGFRGTLGDIGDMFKTWLKQMIATAAKNRIIVAMGLTGSLTGVAGTAAAGSGAAAAAGGAASANGLGLAGTLGGLGSSALSGAAGLWTSLTGAGGGFGAAGTYLSSVLGGATSSLSGFAAAVGAIALPVAAVSLLISGLIGKTKVLDTGIRALISGSDVTVQTYQLIEKSRFWGLSKSTKTKYSAASADLADPVTRAVYDVQASIVAAADSLEIGAEAFDGFTYALKFSTKGLSKDEALEVLEEKLTGLGDAYAGQIEGLAAFQAEGEGAMATITRLASALATVNAAMDTLGNTFRATGLVGADMASQLTQLLGGDEAFGTAVSSYYQAVYSESERLATTTRQTTEALAELGLSMPASRAQYRALVEALDLGTAGGRSLWAALVGMAGVFDEILPQVASFTAQIEALSGTVSTSLDSSISAYTAAQQASAQAATNWYKAADTIAAFLAEMRGTSSAMTSPGAALSYAQGRYQMTLAAAQAGDLDAVTGLTQVAQTYLDRMGAQAGTALELARAQAQVAADLGQTQGIAQIEGARAEAMASLSQSQVDLLTEARDYLAAGNALSDAQIGVLETQLGALDEAITAAAALNYAGLRKQIDLAIDVVEDAQIPAYLKAMLADSATGVSRYVDFIARSDLSAEQKWLALTGASEHVKTVTYLAQNDLGADLTALALATTSSLQKQVRLWAVNSLDAQEMALALAGNSTLARGVRVYLAQGLEADLRAALLATDRAMTRTVAVAVDQSGLSAAQKTLVAALSGGATATIRLGGSFSFDPGAAFASLLGSTVEVPLQAARETMVQLRNHLNALRVAVQAQTAFAQAQAQEVKLAQAQASYAALAEELAAFSPAQAVALPVYSAVTQLMKLGSYVSTGLQSYVVAGQTFKASASDPSLAGLSRSDGSEAYLTAVNALNRSAYEKALAYAQTLNADAAAEQLKQSGLQEALVAAAQELQAMGVDIEIPQFARGGLHGGGLRLVGENGPELEATGASRIWTADQTRRMLSGGEGAQDGLLREVIAELKSLRQENRQLQLNGNSDLRKIRTLEERREAEAQ